MIDYIYKHYDSVASTNDIAKQLINDLEEEFKCHVDLVSSFSYY